MEALRIADASESPGDEPIARFRRLGFVLRAAQESVVWAGEAAKTANRTPEGSEYGVSLAERDAVLLAIEGASSGK